MNSNIISIIKKCRFRHLATTLYPRFTQQLQRIIVECKVPLNLEYSEYIPPFVPSFGRRKLSSYEPFETLVIERRDLDFLKFMVAQGMHFNKRNYSRLPLSVAVMKSTWDSSLDENLVLKFMLENGADPLHPDRDGVGKNLDELKLMM
jgi:hypothetical protein